MIRKFNLSLICFLTIILLSVNYASVINNPAKSATQINVAHTNPFFAKSPLPFQAPQFNLIQDSDYKPAFEEGMKQQLLETQKIADNPEIPTFENTLVALEKSGQLLTRVKLVFNAVTSANTDSVLQKLQEEMAPRLAAHHDAIFLNSKLFERIKSIYQRRKQLKLGNESKRLVSYYYDQFIHAGANLSAEDQIELKKINEEEATLIAQFINKLLAGTKSGALVVSDKSELAGLSPAELNAASQAASEHGLSEKWMIALQNTTQQPALQELDNRQTREKLFENSWNRTEQNDANDTREVIARIAKIRAEKAKLLSFPNYAEWVLEDQMAKNVQAVQKFLNGLVPATISNEQKEATDIQTFIDQSGADIKLQPWDWNYYAEKLRKVRLNLEDSQIKPYFVLENVLEKGVFYAAHELYGITFQERYDIPVYQKDVRVFEIFDKDGSALALFYADFFKQDNKSGGAWMDNFVPQSKLLGNKPVVYNVTNFTKPAAGEPAL